MSTLYLRINSFQDQPYGPYLDLEDALRQANQLWEKRDEMRAARSLRAAECLIVLEIVNDDGTILRHDDILREIQRRPTLREPPKMR